MIKKYYILLFTIYTDAIYFNKVKLAMLVLNTMFLYKIYAYKIEDKNPLKVYTPPCNF